MRLRKKAWKSPGRIYRNDQKLDEVVIYSGTFEIFVEELQGMLTMTYLKHIRYILDPESCDCMRLVSHLNAVW